MKGFERDDQLFSLCGLNCGLCTMRIGGYCPGCGGGEGNQGCAIARCSLRHKGVKYCFQCGEYPCAKYQGADAYDSFITHRNQISDLARAREIGIEAYNEEQRQKSEILQFLLDNFNDGRRKTFYCLAVNLFELEDLESLMSQIDSLTTKPGWEDFSEKEQAKQVVSLFQDVASQRSIELVLRKNPNKGKESL